MESNEIEDDDIENDVKHQEDLDVYSKLEVILKARNKIIRGKDPQLPCSITEDTDLSDVLDENSISTIRTNKYLEENDKKVVRFNEKIYKLKRTSELEMDFAIDMEKNQEDEVSNSISRFRQQSEKLFKKIINCQVGFNECLSSNLMTENVEKSDLIKKHTKLIEQTCKFDRGVEAIINCDKNTLEKHVEKDLKIEDINQFKNVYNDVEQGILSTVYDAGLKKFKNHEHLLAIKEYNKPSKELTFEIVTTGKLDPFTRQPITKPVRNKICKHIYDQDSVDQMFIGKSFVYCPYIGCTNRHFTKSDILSDVNLSNYNK